MKLSHLQNPCWERSGPDSNEAKTRDQLAQIEASVEPITKLREISMEMLLADGMKGPSQRVLDVADDGVDPLELGDLDTVRAAAGDDFPVLVAGRAERIETAQTIGDNRATGSKMVGGPGCNRFQ